MPENLDSEGIVRHVAEVIIGELKLEDVTADTFNPEWTWWMNWALIVWI